MTREMHARTALTIATLALLSACADNTTLPEATSPSANVTAQAGSGFEVWLVDQSNSSGLSYGGYIYIYEGSDLAESSAGSPSPIAKIDLSGLTASMCFEATGAFPVRPHMILFNAAHTHGVLSFVASGHVVIFDGATRAPLACLRTSVGFGGARQAHAAFPSPDGKYLLVANQNGKLLERIKTDYATNTFQSDPNATLNLATCTTPNGAPCEAAGLRSDNAPICPVIDGTSRLGFVTLRGGGLFVVDATATPMAIVGEYDQSTVHANGCGGLEGPNSMFIDSGGATMANMSEFDLYRFPLSGYAPSNPPNTPQPKLLFTADNQSNRDSHGMVLTKLNRYLWVLDRAANVIEVFSEETGKRVNTIFLAGGLSTDPTPDLADISPSGNRIFVSLRGPTPLSGDPHVTTGSTPGLGVMHVTGGGRNGALAKIVRISNVDASGVERADPHGIRVRRR